MHGKIVSFYNPKRNTWLSKGGFNSNDYRVSDSKEVRFKLNKRLTLYYVLISQENGKTCCHQGNSIGWSLFECTGTESRFTELEYLGNDRYKITDGTDVLTTAHGCTGCIYLMPEEDFTYSDEYKEWEIHISECENPG